jgi:hypothetical protein
MNRGRRANPEGVIHRAVVAHLRAYARPEVLWFHVTNNPRNPIHGAQMKALGMMAGVSDLLLFTAFDKFALELKAAGGRPAVAQLEFQDWWRRLGGHAVVAEGLDEAIGCLKMWSVLK